MKKLLYTLLAVSIIFSACKKEDEEPTNNTNNNNSGNSTNLSIGDTHQGGIIFYLDGNGGGLIAAPTDYSMGSTYRVEWGCFGTAISGSDGTAIGTGNQNTIDIENGCTSAEIAADVCANYIDGNYSDWFLPSKDELNLMYLNLHLQGLGGFALNWYWSSTEDDSDLAWDQQFVNGDQDTDSKNNESYVRPIRAF